MLAENLKIFKATREAFGIMLGYTKNVSREVKFAEWADARKAMNDALDIIFVINSETDYTESARLVQQYLFHIYQVRNRIRLLAENGYLSVKFKTTMILKLEECSKQGVGWRNYYANKARVREQRAN